MNKFLRMMLVSAVMLAAFVALAPATASAQDGLQEASDTISNLRGAFSIYIGASAGAGIVMLGAGFGIGRIGAAAVESMSRQPEVAARVQTAMIISAALIEGATFFGLIVCMITIFV